MSNRIKDLSAETFDLPLKEPFIVATGRKDAANNVLIRVTLEDGKVGYGEVSPSPYTTGDTQATVIAVINQLKPVVVGRDICSWRQTIADARRSVRHQFAAHSGLEIAILDAFGRHTNTPMWQFFGGAVTSVDCDFTLSLGTPDEAAKAAAKAAGEGFLKLKIKVGMTVETDTERVVEAKQAAPQCKISLDANQGFTPRDAVALVRRLEKKGIEITLLEQPVRRDDFAGMRFVREHTRVPVGADETVFTPADAIRLVREDAADMINIKIAKAGLVGAMDIASIAQAANLGLMVGCMMESKVGLAASVHLACGLGCFSLCDLDSVFLLKPFECEGGYTLKTPAFSVDGIGPGTGIELKRG